MLGIAVKVQSVYVLICALRKDKKGGGILISGIFSGLHICKIIVSLN